MPNLDAPPREQILVIIWEADLGRWTIAEQHTDEPTARGQRDLYRHELGTKRARLIRTADGE